MFEGKTPVYVQEFKNMLDELKELIQATSPRLDELEQRQIDFENRIKKEQIEFYKEITDKYFENIEMCKVPVAEFDGVYDDMLINIFEDETGLRLSL